MTTPETVRQGASYDFTVTVSGDDTLTGTYEVKQYPGDTATLTGSLTSEGDGDFSGTLSGADTLTLGVGQWIIFTEFTDSDEDVSDPQKIYISVAW